MEVAAQTQREVNWQTKYRYLLQRRDDLLEKINKAKQGPTVQAGSQAALEFLKANAPQKRKADDEASAEPKRQAVSS